MNEVNVAKFRDFYAVKLVEAMKRHPEDYFYGEAEAPAVAAKMTKALAEGNANLGPAAKAVARALSIKPTQRDIKAFLNE